MMIKTKLISVSLPLVLWFSSEQYFAQGWVSIERNSLWFGSTTRTTTTSIIPTHRMTATENEQQRDNNHNNDNILEDSTGHINRDLAERIWNWEQEYRKQKNLPKVEYSIRSGLRLVDEMVQEIVDNQSNRKLLSESNKNNLYGDLIQEGLTALLDAMSNYRVEEKHEDFESYASDEIYKHLISSIDAESRPLRLPKRVRNIVQEANRLMRQQAGNTITLDDVADKLNIPIERLKDYLRLAKSTGSALSMESTVEIFNPMIEDSAPAFRDQDEWELGQGLLLDDGKSIKKEELVDDYIDESLQREGDDDAWVQQEQIAGPLQDLIPDTEISTVVELDDDIMIIEELIRNDISEFLSSTLQPNQVKAIRLYFGLDTGKQLSINETAIELQQPVDDVKALLKHSVQDLRKAYAKKYIQSSSHDDSDNDNNIVEESV